MIDGLDNIKEMSLRLDKLTPKFQTIPGKPGIESIPRSWCETQSGIRSLCYMIVRQKPEQTFVFKILYAVILNFQLLT